MLYTLTLSLHSITRWAVIIFGVMVIAQAVIGIAGKRAWLANDQRGVSGFFWSVNIQIVLGLILYVFLSPVIQGALRDFGGAMRDGRVRFWLVEHMTMMIVALGLVHIGVARIRRAAEAPAKHRAALIFFGIAMLAILISIPWPGTGTDPRPLYRLPW